MKYDSFSNAEFWNLYQYFYTPPPSIVRECINCPSTAENCSKSSCSSNESHRNYRSPCEKKRGFVNTHEVEQEADDRPVKRPVNASTMARISRYPRIKVSFYLYHFLFIYFIFVGFIGNLQERK
jgi:hypothetical protein